MIKGPYVMQHLHAATEAEKAPEKPADVGEVPPDEA